MLTGHLLFKPGNDHRLPQYGAGTGAIDDGRAAGVADRSYVVTGTDAYSDAYSDANTNTNTDANTNTNTNTYSDADADANTYTYTDANTDANTSAGAIAPVIATAAPDTGGGAGLCDTGR
jgi:hypothetical protein